MSKLPDDRQIEQEIITATLNDETIDWLYRILASAEMQYRASEEDET
ncbi:hypothetical protein J2T13_000835 [Paenibacillus sp. DS2015]